MARTDIHRPASPDFDPAAYDCWGVWDLNPEWPDREGTQERLSIVNDLRKQGYRCGAHGMHQCGHCGTSIRYAALMVRENAKEFIWVGETCLDNRFNESKADFDRLRKTAALHRDRIAKAERITALVGGCPELVWATYPDLMSTHYGEFVADVAAKFRERGELTDRQIESWVKAFTRETERKITQEQRAAAVAAGTIEPAPEGRVVVEGEVVFTAADDTAYGIVPVMIVKADAGWTVKVTVPASLHPRFVGHDARVYAKDVFKVTYGVTKGDRVRFTATLSQGKSDPTKAYGKRPTGAALVV